jgi:hypothetical protein
MNMPRTSIRRLTIASTTYTLSDSASIGSGLSQPLLHREPGEDLRSGDGEHHHRRDIAALPAAWTTAAMEVFRYTARPRNSV